MEAEVGEKRGWIIALSEMEESPWAKEYRQRYKLEKAMEWIFPWKLQPSGPVLDLWHLELYENKYVLL